jgi:hypothetical protein
VPPDRESHRVPRSDRLVPRRFGPHGHVLLRSEASCGEEE